MADGGGNQQMMMMMSSMMLFSCMGACLMSVAGIGIYQYTTCGIPGLEMLCQKKDTPDVFGKLVDITDLKDGMGGGTYLWKVMTENANKYIRPPHHDRDGEGCKKDYLIVGDASNDSSVDDDFKGGSNSWNPIYEWNIDKMDGDYFMIKSSYRMNNNNKMCNFHPVFTSGSYRQFYADQPPRFHRSWDGTKKAVRNEHAHFQILEVEGKDRTYRIKGKKGLDGGSGKYLVVNTTQPTNFDQGSAWTDDIEKASQFQFDKVDSCLGKTKSSCTYIR